jgi:hypothetical protein
LEADEAKRDVLQRIFSAAKFLAVANLDSRTSCSAHFLLASPYQAWARSVVFDQPPVIQTPKVGARIMRYELADYEWLAIKPMLPNKPRGVPRVNDRQD